MYVQAKVQMLDNLLDIEVAYSLLRGGAQDNDNDPIDINYEKLKTQIEVRCADHLNVCRLVYGKERLRVEFVLIILQVVDKNSEEANVIMQYVKNTHAATHNTYTLEVQEVSGLWKTLTQIVCALCDFCCAVLLLLCMKYCVVFDPPQRSSRLGGRENVSVSVPSRSCTTGSCCGTVLVPPTTLVFCLRVFASLPQKLRW